jgi:hypothetical protein
VTELVCGARDETPKYLSACKGLPEYGKTGYCVLHFPSEDKKDAFKKTLESKVAQTDYDFGGVLFPENTFQVQERAFHEPVIFNGATFVGGANFLSITFNSHTDFSNAEFSGNANFSGTTFSGKANFSGATFGGAAYFSGVTFNEEVSFRKAAFEGNANFSGATFNKQANLAECTFDNRTRFRSTTFNDSALFVRTIFEDRAIFLDATFNKAAGFMEATFNKTAHFTEVTFGGTAYFNRATFNEWAGFLEANFKDRASFHRLQTYPHTAMGFAYTTAEKPERVSFHSIHLRPSWFVDAVDAQKFDFSDVEWFELPDGNELRLENEIKYLESRDIKSPQSLRKLNKSCQRLMINAEENRDYPTANEFHYWSMETQREEIPGSAFAPWKLIWWYWLLSGYNERPVRAAFWLVVMLLGFAGLYMWQGPVGVQESSLVRLLQAGLESVVYSLGVMTRLANAVPESESVLVRSLIILEGVLGPVQFALFALALRRRFMR